MCVSYEGIRNYVLIVSFISVFIDCVILVGVGVVVFGVGGD